MSRKVRYEDLRKIIYRYGCVFLVVIIGALFYLAGHLNVFFTDVFLSKFSVKINNIVFDFNETRSVIIAPIIEETIKFIGYGVIFLIPFKFLQSKYRSKKEFINKNIVYAFLISAGLFGFLEGCFHNGHIRIGFYLYVLLNVCIHSTYSLYPFILGRRYRNWFICFLPIAITLHALHNFLILFIWDNKWVTFIMVTVFLVPFMVLERSSILQYIRKFEFCGVSIPKVVAYSLLICLYILMLLAVAFYH
ncbi:MAG: hypothetical protein KKA79_06690 [Nanoarchaeota archaeon]|nr:hypothetical protein [Nanoarchaeota archaeon]MCG2718589.1 hypothetical protein [Nanoarchaeota archaeon]